MTIINIIVFTTRECTTCKPVLRQLDQIVRYVEPGRVAVTKIDAKENPTLAAQFHVRQVPYVYYNDELVLDPQTAAVLQDSSESRAIFDVLFNKLLEVMTRDSDQHHEMAKKLSVIKITENVIKTEGIMSGFAQTRPTIGDYVHIGVLQAITSSILLINPRARKYMFEAGLLSGRYGSVQGWLRQHYPDLDGRSGTKALIRSFFRGINQYYGSMMEGGNYMFERLQVPKNFHKRFSLEIIDSAFAAKMPDVGEALCYYLAGELAGIMEVILGTPVAIQESKCLGLGDDTCNLKVKLEVDETCYVGLENQLSMESSPNQHDLSPVASLEYVDYREKLEQAITHITNNKYLSVLYKQRMRPRAGDFVHMSLLQKSLIGIKYSEPLNSALLFHAGVNFGQVLGDGGRLIHFIMERKSMPKRFPLSFTDAVYILSQYLNSSASQFDREHGDVDYELIDDETARLRIYECAIASGINLVQMGNALQAALGEDSTSIAVPLCDFYAGVIKGRLELLADEDIDVKEVACHSTGADYCEFEINVD